MINIEGEDAAEKLFDVFLCYKSEDLAVALALHQAMKSRGLEVFLDKIEGEIWAPLTRSIEQALARSRTLVALITENFPISPHCREELHVALSAAYYLDAGETSRVMAVVQGISPDHVRPAQLTMYRLPYGGAPPAELVETIVRNVQAHDGFIGDAPTVTVRNWYPQELPGNRYFRGRFDELWDIHSGMRAREKNRDRGKPCVVVSGLGGQGKTALSLQYARLFARDHPSWVFVLDLAGSDGRSDSGHFSVETRFNEHLRLIAAGLSLPDPAGIPAALDALDAPYLWILDDVPAGTHREQLFRMLAPTRAGRTLITTRGRFERFGSHEFTLRELDKVIGAAVLTAYCPAASTDRQAVRDIVKMLGGHPLGLTIAAGLTTLPSFAGYQGLLTDLSSTEPDRLEGAHLEAELPAGCSVSFSRVLLRSFNSLGDAGREVMCAASVLAPARIPRNLLFGIVGRANGGDEFDDGVGRGAARGLLSIDAAGCSMHPLVARAVRALVWPPSRRILFRTAAMAELTAAVERTRDEYRHREVLDYLPHVRAVAGLLPGGDNWDIGLDERYLLNETGRVQSEAGSTRDALATFEAFRKVCTRNTVDPHTYCVVLTGLAVAHGLEGHHSIALSLKLEAVRILSAERGPAAAETLTAVNNLAVTHLEMEHYEEAYEQLRMVYILRRDHGDLGPTHRDTLIALNNLAIARRHLGRTDAERDLNRRIAHRISIAAWDRWRRIAKPDDQNALNALNGLALSYRSLGFLAEALRLTTDLYARRETLLGPDHPDTLGTLENKLILQEEIDERER
ncbi:tetratricopeptide (TPR) repeat protein [Nocardia transvalensis]|uniref:Tetratricopeptide (TPR) repeat protein n=1 Tax=Nocardia transvalensis TaxID=37333 RepID=A0A7W9UM79_9NOCA|nr:TIR domain-containing protein [Nocardia transvalensis]MBB5917505.1 tetratricopeptide (TPR) repeat protein [Nocardia transvalensis]